MLKFNMDILQILRTYTNSIFYGHITLLDSLVARVDHMPAPLMGRSYF